ncbi:MAG: hypothetical protein Q4C87_12110 [Actinomycetaceae bacterium]|nr:hypothetical protein [Actinomycetaceae bacterium]
MHPHPHLLRILGVPLVYFCAVIMVCGACSSSGTIPSPLASGGSQSGVNAQSVGTSGQSTSENASTGIPPSLDSLKNATVTIPRACADFSLQRDQPATFSQGVTEGKTPRHKVTIKQLLAATLDEKPATLLVFSCATDAATHESIGAYNANMELIGALEPWEASQEKGSSRIFSGNIWNFTFGNEITAKGSTLSFTVPHINAFGDNPGKETPGRYFASADLKWTGNTWEATTIIYHSPNGDVITPRRTEIHSLMAADPALKGKEADECALAPSNPMIYPANLGGQEKILAGWEKFLSESSSSREQTIRPGDFVCGVPSGSSPPPSAQSAQGDEYDLWFIVRSPAEGSPKIITVGGPLAGY